MGEKEPFPPRDDSRRNKSIIAGTFDSGFNGSGYFVRKFKSNFGMTPQDWRGKMGGGYQRHMAGTPVIISVLKAANANSFYKNTTRQGLRKTMPD